MTIWLYKRHAAGRPRHGRDEAMEIARERSLVAQFLNGLG